MDARHRLAKVNKGNPLTRKGELVRGLSRTQTPNSVNNTESC
nr:MAG TPA: hypothetical protein [Caudoviricetes sp.]